MLYPSAPLSLERVRRSRVAWSGIYDITFYSPTKKGAPPSSLYPHCPENNLNIRTQTELVTFEAMYTVYEDEAKNHGHTVYPLHPFQM